MEAINPHRVHVDPRDAQTLLAAVRMQLCLIETGTQMYRALEAEKINRDRMPNIVLELGVGKRPPLTVPNTQEIIQIRALSREDRDRVSRLEDLMEELRTYTNEN